MIKTLTPIIAILAIVGLELYALHLGVNGVLLAGTVAVIAGLGGYTTKVLKDKKKVNNRG